MTICCSRDGFACAPVSRQHENLPECGVVDEAVFDGHQYLTLSCERHKANENRFFQPPSRRNDGHFKMISIFEHCQRQIETLQTAR